MKTTIITFISLILMSGSCIAQEPDTHSYSDRIIDSLNGVISTLEYKYDSLKNSQFSIFDMDTIDIWKDDIYFRVREGRMTGGIFKNKHNIMFELYDSETNRRHISNYIDYKSLQQITD